MPSAPRLRSDVPDPVSDGLGFGRQEGRETRNKTDKSQDEDMYICASHCNLCDLCHQCEPKLVMSGTAGPLIHK